MAERSPTTSSSSDDDNTDEVDNYVPVYSYDLTVPKEGDNSKTSGDEATARRRILFNCPDKGICRRRISVEQPVRSRRSSVQSVFPNDRFNPIYKIIVVGEIYSGKSSLIKRYVHNFFSGTYYATVGLDFTLKIIHYNEDNPLQSVRLQLWDIAGQERFTSMTRVYYKGTMGAVIVFDLTKAYTFHVALEKWKADIDEKCELPKNRSVPVLLIANKSDLKRDPELPDDVEISKLIQEKGFIPNWFKTSAKTGENVDDAMGVLLKYIMAMDDWSPCKSPPEANHFGRFHMTCNPPRNLFQGTDVLDLPTPVAGSAGSKAKMNCAC